MQLAPNGRQKPGGRDPQSQSPGRLFRHPEPTAGRCRVWPVFLTFQGCPGRCVFCAQHLQSGRPPLALGRVLAELESSLDQAAAAAKGPYELAFYGGVFTALPEPWPWRFLDLARHMKERGLVSRVRCSTRPDACAPGLLARLAAAGLDMVEIGGQTFCDPVLAAAGRGHDAAAIRRACRDVREAGLDLGLQLLPGLPGHTPADLAADAAEAAALKPRLVRLHPCLVPRGTPLAALYQAGQFTPWTLAETIDALAKAVPVLWRAGVRVARIGLSPEPGFLAAVLAGPWHPALGAMVRARALLDLVADEVRHCGRAPAGLAAPRRFAGEFFGHKAELARDYAALGLPRSAVRFEAREDFLLFFDPV